MPDLKMRATDMTPVYLDKALNGIYSVSSLRDIPEEIRSNYFRPQKGGDLYLLTSSMKKDISWRVHHLLHDPPELDFHLIFLRNNLLTYYKDDLKELALRKVVHRLIPGGFLIIGSHEKIPFDMPNLTSFGRLPYIFKKSRSG